VSTLSILLTRRNEELDDKAVIRRLKQRISELEKEVIMLREGTAPEAAGMHIHLVLNWRASFIYSLSS